MSRQRMVLIAGSVLVCVVGGLAWYVMAADDENGANLASSAPTPSSAAPDVQDEAPPEAVTESVAPATEVVASGTEGSSRELRSAIEEVVANGGFVGTAVVDGVESAPGEVEDSLGVTLRLTLVTALYEGGLVPGQTLTSSLSMSQLHDQGVSDALVGFEGKEALVVINGAGDVLSFGPADGSPLLANGDVGTTTFLTMSTGLAEIRARPNEALPVASIPICLPGSPETADWLSGLQSADPVDQLRTLLAIAGTQESRPAVSSQQAVAIGEREGVAVDAVLGVPVPWNEADILAQLVEGVSTDAVRVQPTYPFEITDAEALYNAGTVAVGFYDAATLQYLTFAPLGAWDDAGVTQGYLEISPEVSEVAIVALDDAGRSSVCKPLVSLDGALVVPGDAITGTARLSLDLSSGTTRALTTEQWAP